MAGASVSRVLIVCVFALGMSLTAALAAPKTKVPKKYVCDSATNACVCRSNDPCKDMLAMCKDRTMVCQGDLCSCTRARALPGAEATGVPAGGKATAATVGN